MSRIVLIDKRDFCNDIFDYVDFLEHDLNWCYDTSGLLLIVYKYQQPGDFSAECFSEDVIIIIIIIASVVFVSLNWSKSNWAFIYYFSVISYRRGMIIWSIAVLMIISILNPKAGSRAWPAIGTFDETLSVLVDLHYIAKTYSNWWSSCRCSPDLNLNFQKFYVMLDRSKIWIPILDPTFGLLDSLSIFTWWDFRCRNISSIYIIHILFHSRLLPFLGRWSYDEVVHDFASV